MAIINNGTIVLIAAGKGFTTLSALKPAPSAPRHCPLQLLGCRYMYPCNARTYLPAAI